MADTAHRPQGMFEVSSHIRIYALDKYEASVDEDPEVSICASITKQWGIKTAEL